MQIPLSTSQQSKRPPLELLSIKLYSTGIKKVFTDHFYKSMNRNFGVEITIRNNTSKMQEMKIGGCIYDSNKNKAANWIGNKKINPHSTIPYDFYVTENTFSKLNAGKYVVIFWINDKKVKESNFTITYKRHNSQGNEKSLGSLSS